MGLLVEHNRLNFWAMPKSIIGKKKSIICLALMLTTCNMNSARNLQNKTSKPHHIPPHHTLHILTTHHISPRHYLIVSLTLHTYPLSPTPHTLIPHTTHTLTPHTTHTLTPHSSPRARQVCGSESSYTLLVSSWGPVTHTSTSAGQCGRGPRYQGYDVPPQTQLVQDQ